MPRGDLLNDLCPSSSSHGSTVTSAGTTVTAIADVDYKHSCPIGEYIRV